MSEGIERECQKLLRGIKEIYSNLSTNNYLALQKDLLIYSQGNLWLTTNQLSSFIRDRKGDITEEQLNYILEILQHDEQGNYTIAQIQQFFSQINGKYPTFNLVVSPLRSKLDSPGKNLENKFFNNQIQQNGNHKSIIPSKNQKEIQMEEDNQIILVNTDDEEDSIEEQKLSKSKDKEQNEKNKQNGYEVQMNKNQIPDDIIFKENEQMIPEDSFDSLNQKLGFLKERHIQKKIDLNDIKTIFTTQKIKFDEILFFLSSYGVELKGQEQSLLKQSLVDDETQTEIYIKDFLEFMNLNDDYYKKSVEQKRNNNNNNNNSNNNKINDQIGFLPPPPNLYNYNINNNKIINYPLNINNLHNVHPNNRYNNDNNNNNNNQNRNRIFDNYYPPQPHIPQQFNVIPNHQIPQNLINFNPNNVVPQPNNNQNNQIIHNQNIQNQMQIGNNNNNNNYNNHNPKNILLNSQCEQYEFPDEQIEGFEQFCMKFHDCEINHKEFIDSEFPPSEDSIVNNKANKHYHEWRKLGWYRPIGFFKGESYSMFDKFKSMSQSRVGLGKLITPNDIQQGMLGDCYFLSALSCLAQEPHRILNLFLTRKTNAFGIYCVKICHDGEWKAITLDDHIPCLHKRPAFTKANGNELWVLLIEKAWAKLFRSYAKIESGYCNEALRDLTGAPTANFLTFEDGEVNGHKIQQMNQNLLPILMDALSESNRFLITAANDSQDLTKSQADRLGLVTSHAYSVIGFKEITHPQLGKVTLVRLRNPWGKKEWTGDWSDSSKLWTQELREELRVTQRQDGIFYMSVQDFYQYFNQITICYYHDFFKYNSRKVLQSDGKHSKYFTMKVTTKGTYYISIVQPSSRNFDKDINYSYGAGRILIAQLSDEFGKSHIKFIGSYQKKSREIFVECNLEPGLYIIQSKVTWDFPVSTSYVVSSYGVNSTQIDLIQKSLLPNQYLEECFKLHARKNSNLKLQGQIMKCKHIDHKLGYGYYYIQNITNQAIQISLNFQHSKGLKFKKPQRAPLIQFIVVPQSECIALFTVSCQGYHMQYSENIQQYY